MINGEKHVFGIPFCDKALYPNTDTAKVMYDYMENTEMVCPED